MLLRTLGPCLCILLCTADLVGSHGSTLPDTMISQDGAEMKLIAATKFPMGTKESALDEIIRDLSRYTVGRPIQRNWFEDELPQHLVFLDAYYIDKYEVTNAQYARFMEATGHSEPAYWHDARFNQSSQPVVGVSWYDAMTYAQWAGKTLPTEAQWENAARAKRVDSRYPWGDTWPPPADTGNFLEQPTAGYADGYAYTSPVGRFSPNDYGIHDLIGNVAEWCLDVYSEAYYAVSPRSDPVNEPNLDVRVLRVVRGGGWSGTPVQLRCAYRGRDIPSGRYNLLGFRCALPTHTDIGDKEGKERQQEEQNIERERPKDEETHQPDRAPSSQEALGFTDVTEAAGIDFHHIAGLTAQRNLIETMGSGCVFFDYDNDGYLDLYVVNSGEVPGKGHNPDTGQNRLYRNNRNGTFTDVTQFSGTGHTGYGMGANAADYDNDGDQDLYVMNFGANVLYRNNGDGTFTDVTQDAGVIDDAWSVSCAFLDFDRDSDLDLYVVNYVEYDLSMKPCLNNNKGILEYCHPRYFTGKADVLYRNNGDGTFTDHTRQAGVYNTVEGKGLGVTVSDYNNDGLPDIYVANDTTPNFLYRNNGDGTFTDVGLISGTGYNLHGLPEGGMGVDFGDYNNDGWQDLFVTNSSAETNTLYRNNADGTFTDVTEVAGLAEPSYLMLAFGTKFLDYNNDGNLDLLVVNGHLQPDIARLSEHITYAQNDHLYQNNGDGTFTELSASLGGYFTTRYVGRGAAFGDYDNDGDTDVFVVNSDQRGVLLRNDVGNKHNWIRIQLIGTKSNRDGIGTRVGVRCGNLLQIPEVHSGASYASGSDRRLLFGLGEAEEIQQIVVKWPSGITQQLTNVEVNQSIQIVESDTE